MGNRSTRRKASGLDQALPWAPEDSDTSGAQGVELGTPPAADAHRAEPAGDPGPSVHDELPERGHPPPPRPDAGSTAQGMDSTRQASPKEQSSRRRKRASESGELTPEQRVLRARMAAYRLHATHDPRETTRKAREAFAGRFEREVDPDGVLSPAERARRAEAARRAYFTGLALRSSRARRRAV